MGKTFSDFTRLCVESMSDHDESGNVSEDSMAGVDDAPAKSTKKVEVEEEEDDSDFSDAGSDADDDGSDGEEHTAKRRRIASEFIEMEAREEGGGEDDEEELDEADRTLRFFSYCYHRSACTPFSWVGCVSLFFFCLGDFVAGGEELAAHERAALQRVARRDLLREKDFSGGDLYDRLLDKYGGEGGEMSGMLFFLTRQTSVSRVNTALQKL
jgi:hypothetical protein